MASALIAATATVATAQNTTAAYFTKDYKFRHTMNPAYGNDQTTSHCQPWVTSTLVYMETLALKTSSWTTLCMAKEATTVSPHS